MSIRKQQEFKTCPNCGKVWKDRYDFIDDLENEIVGYQVSFKELEAGLFLFYHSCGTTLALPVAPFLDLYDGEIFEERATGSDECPEYCLQKDNLDPCPARCECAFVREIIQIIKSRRVAV